MTKTEAEKLIEEIDRSLAVVVRARDEDLAAACPTVDNIVLADARSFRARLADEISGPAMRHLPTAGEEPTIEISASPRDLHSASVLADCAQAMKGTKTTTLVLVGAAALALAALAFSV
jgi:hypothetical protein